MTKTRTAYMQEFSRNEVVQVLDCGSQIQKNPKKSVSKKAELIIKMMASMKPGYKLEAKNLLYKKWRKWVFDNPSFKASDILSMTDVRDAVKEFYRLVSIGELKFADGIPRMLQCVQFIDGVIELQVVHFQEGLFTLVDNKPKSEPEATEVTEATESEVTEAIELPEEIDVLGSVEAMLQGHILPSERAILERALHDLKIVARQSA